jgi:hypothetical protein
MDMRLRFTIVELSVMTLALFVFGSTGYDVYRTRLGDSDGRRDASADLAAGKFRLKIGGLQRPWDARAVSLFKDRYGIELQRVHGCAPTTYQLSYTRAYNNVMMDGIVEESGQVSIVDVFDEAREEWEKTAAN